MPIEIRELIIKATVSDVSMDNRNTPRNGNQADAREAEVNVIVEKVLEILKDQAER